jgi:hypothetical protein
MWKLIQFLIIAAVGVANAHWQWTPNTYLAAGLGYALAYLVTVVSVWITDRLPLLTAAHASLR